MLPSRLCMSYPETAVSSMACAASLLLLLGGCAQSPCDEAKGMYDRANAKLKGCPDREPYGFEPSTCSAHVKACTAEDQATLDQVKSCLDALPACTSDTEQSWTDAASRCVTQSPVTTGCAAALGPSASK